MFSSPSTHREYVDGVLALAVAFATCVGYVSSVYWEGVVAPRLFRRRELTLGHQIMELEAEAERVCAASKLFEHSRLTRRALRLRQALETERQKRLAYEVSVSRVFRCIFDIVFFILRLSQPASEAAEPHSAGAVVPGIQSRTLQDSSKTATTSSSMRTHDSAYSPAAPHGWRALAEHTVHTLWYNAANIIKYVLRFGSAAVLLCVFGNRSMFTAAPSSLTETPRHCVTELMPRLFLNAFFSAPPGQGSSIDAHEGKTRDNTVGAIRAGPARAALPESFAYSSAAKAKVGGDANTSAAVQSVDIWLYGNTDLLSWLLTCYLAVYLALRVFCS